MTRTTVIIAAAAALTGVVAWMAPLAKPPATEAVPAERRPVWSETAWPFPIDQWGKGKAFRCAASDCGSDVVVYIRAKIGFCNCATGVADDDELDRIGDADLLGKRLSPRGPGRPIMVAWMKGRSRDFFIDGPQGANKSVLSVGFNDRCDAIVATAVHQDRQNGKIEPAVLEFLNSKTVLSWAETTLGL